MPVEPAKMMEDEEVIRRRLLIDGDGTGDARMLTKFTRAFLKFCASDDSTTELESQHDRLLTTLSSIEQSSIKWDNMRQMNEFQADSYEDLGAVTQTAVDDAQGALSQAKEDLEKARKVRANCLEYHALAKLIQEHPERLDTADKIKDLSESLDKLQSTKNKLEDQLDLRKKQLHALFTTLYQLEAGLQEDEQATAVATKPSTPEPETSKPIVDLTEDMDCSN